MFIFIWSSYFFNTAQNGKRLLRELSVADPTATKTHTRPPRFT